MNNIYEQQLDKSEANFESLSPLLFLERTANVFPDKLAVVYGDLRRNWSSVYSRSCQLASALTKLGIVKGDTVAVIAPNLPEVFEAHFGIPMSGAVLNTINTRLDVDNISFILGHAEAKVLLVDSEFLSTAQAAIDALNDDFPHPKIVVIKDPTIEHTFDLQAVQASADDKELVDYEAFLKTGDADFAWQVPNDEWDAISLNYTSGTTGNPKGVVYHHRGAYLNAINNAVTWEIPQHACYLWTLPMFHCNGWCFPWTMAAKAGVNVCLRAINTQDIFSLIKQEKVTHFCAAPIVLNMMNNAPDNEKTGFEHQIKVMTAGSAPPASVIQGMESLGIEVTHTYGLTETYGPSVVCAWDSDWNDLDISDRAMLKSRQGVRTTMLEGLDVLDPDTMQPVPRDGKTIGEVMIRGNIVMKGYLKNSPETKKSFDNGWFHSGDLGVCHSNGYIELKDRSKDIIISGGENISSIEIEGVLYQHPEILEAAVIAKPDEKWGEVPIAFVKLKNDSRLTDVEIIAFCRARMATFKAPKEVRFGEIPKTSTGKIQKFELRKMI